MRNHSVWGRTSSGGRMKASMRRGVTAANATYTRLKWWSVCAAGWSATRWTAMRLLFSLLIEDRYHVCVCVCVCECVSV